MKKISLYLLPVVGCLTAYAGIVKPLTEKTVESISVHETVMAQQPASMTVRVAPVSRSVDDTEAFTLDDITSWAGDGLKRAALVVQWNDNRETKAMVFGYRFNGQATGYDMLKAIVEEYPYLYAMAGDSDLGKTVGGFGLDVNKTGNFTILKNGTQSVSLNPNEVYNSGQGYAYDGITAADNNDYWASGWMDNYWSYWIGTPGEFEYSALGVSNHNVADGGWYGWNFIPATDRSGDEEVNVTWKPFAAAEPYYGNSVTEVDNAGLHYAVTNRNLNTVELVRPASGSYTMTGDVKVPSTFTVDGVTYKVTRVADGAFDGAAAGKVVLPESVYSVGDGALANMPNLTSAKLPSNLYGLGSSLFASSKSVTDAIFPEGYNTVPEKQFYATSIASLDIPENITEIGVSAFEGTKIETLLFSENHTPRLLSRAFANCAELKTVTVILSEPFEIAADAFESTGATLIVPKGSKAAFEAAQGWNKFANIEDSYAEVTPGTEFVYNAVRYRIGEGNTASVIPADPTATTYAKIKTANNKAYTGEIEIPSKVLYQGTELTVTAVEPLALAGSAITKLTIGSGIEIGYRAFAECRKLAEVVLPTSITALPDYCFYYCDKLITINLPEGLREIGGSCFAETKVSATVPSSVERLGGAAFYNTKITEFVQPAAMKQIPDSVFMNCSALTKAVFNDGTKLGAEVCRKCSALTEIRLPADLEVLPKNFFYSCSKLANIVLPSTLKEIGTQSLSYTAIESIDIPEGVTVMGTFVFSGDTKLKKVVLPDAITVIGNGMFGGCSQLEEVTMSDNVTKIDGSAFGGRFSNCPKLAKITIVGDESGESRLPSKLEYIGNEAFRGDALLEVAMSPAIKTVGDRAFYDCTKMVDFTMPVVETIGHEAFRGTSISTFVFPETIKTLGCPLFFGCPIKDERVYACGSGVYLKNNSSSSSQPLSKSYGGSVYPSFTLVVPTGHTNDAHYTTTASWGEGVEYIAPELQSMSFGTTKADVEGSDVKFSADFNIVYDMTEMPELFTTYNNRVVTSNCVFQVWYRKAGEPSESLKSVDAVYDGNTVTAAIDGLAPGDYTYFFQYREGQMPTRTDEFSFTIEQPDPGFKVTVDGVEVVNGVYTLGVKKTYKLTADVDNSTLTYTIVNNEAGAGTYNKWSNAIITNTKEGTFALEVADATDPTKKVILNFEVKINKHVESITLDGLVDGVLTVDYNSLLAVNPTILPADADITDFEIEIEDPTMAKIYAAKAFNPTRNFYELSTFKVGETNITYRATDGSGTELTFKVKVNDRDREGKIDYTKGMFWLNEEWFGHNNGSINFVDDQFNVTYKVYERENPWQSFGATSQFATIYADKLFVMSKQPRDGGDPRDGGGRLVIADAKTLKTIATFAEIGGDGRACVGVSPEKVYIGHTAGIRVLNINGDNYSLASTDIEGIVAKNAYSGQVGDMVKAGKYVFAVQQSTGLHVIDTTTDRLVKTFEETNAAGVVQSADGNVWFAAKNKLYCYDPATLKLLDTKAISQNITCNWGTWKSTSFKAAKNENVLFWGLASVYRWEIGKELPTEPVFALGRVEGMNGSYQGGYGTLGYDDFNNRLLIATTHGSSSNYRYNWYYFVDATTGEILNSQALVPYYWFPAIAVNPDRCETVIDLDDINLKNNGEAFEADLTELVSDDDDINSAIDLKLVASPDDIAVTTLEGRNLKVVPTAEGNGQLTLAAESRGHVTTKTVNVVIEHYDAIGSVVADNITVKVGRRRITVKGAEGEEFRVFDTMGRMAAVFVAESDCHTVDLTVPAGVYVINGAGKNIKAVVR